MTFSHLFQSIQEKLHLTHDPAEREQQRLRAIQLATAGLLLDVAHADDTFDESERVRLTAHLSSQFALDDNAARDLITAANVERNRSVDYFGFANLLRQNLPMNDRMSIVRTMWRIVFADGALSAHEEHLVGKLSQLLGIERHHMIDEKVAIKREFGVAGV